MGKPPNPNPQTYITFIRDQHQFLSFGFGLMFFSCLGQTFFISLFGDEIRETYQLSNQDFGLVYSIATALSGILLVGLGSRIDHIPLRIYVLVLTGAQILFTLLMGTVPIFFLFIMALFGIRFVGQGLMTHAASTSMARYLSTQKGKALSVATQGLWLGNAILPFLIVQGLQVFHWGTLWYLSSAALILILIPLLLWSLHKHELRHSHYLSESSQAEVPEIQESQKIHWTRAEVLRDPRFYLLLPAIASSPFLITGLFFHQTHIIPEKGWTMETWAAAFGVFSISSVISTLTTGNWVDRLDSRSLLAWVILPLAVGFCLLGFQFPSWMAFIIMIVLGINGGGIGTVVNSLWVDLYGTRHLGSIKALSTGIMVLSTSLSPFIFGALLDRQWSSEAIALASAGYTVLSLGLALIGLYTIRAPIQETPK